MKHFTTRGSGSGEDLPRRVWVGSKPNQNERGPLLSSGGLVFWGSPVQGTCEEDSQHPHIPAPPGSGEEWGVCVCVGGTGCPHLWGECLLPPSKEGRAPFINLLVASRTLYVEWCLGSVSNKSWTGKLPRDVLLQNLKKTQGEVMGQEDGGLNVWLNHIFIKCRNQKQSCDPDRWELWWYFQTCFWLKVLKFVCYLQFVIL